MCRFLEVIQDAKLQPGYHVVALKMDMKEWLQIMRPRTRNASGLVGLQAEGEVKERWTVAAAYHAQDLLLFWFELRPCLLVWQRNLEVLRFTSLRARALVWDQLRTCCVKLRMWSVVSEGIAGCSFLQTAWRIHQFAKRLQPNNIADLQAQVQ